MILNVSHPSWKRNVAAIPLFLYCVFYRAALDKCTRFAPVHLCISAIAMSQQIYLPLGGQYPIPFEFEADTMQVPRGQYSAISELQKGNLTSAEAMIYFTLNHGSTWNSGATWGMSTRYLSKSLGIGMSRTYVQKTLASLTDKGWIKVLHKENPLGYQYQIRHHLCKSEDVPVDRDGKPLKFAVPRAAGGPIERCIDGDISWKAALAWMMLKYFSNWKAHEDTAGQTKQASLLTLSKRCRLSLATYQPLVTELEVAGMLQRLTPKSQKAIFQLFPKPFPKPVKPASKRDEIHVFGVGVIEYDGEYYYSRNNQYRCRGKDGEIQRRQRGGMWKRISDYERGQVMPRSILRDFDRCLEVRRAFEDAGFSS